MGCYIESDNFSALIGQVLDNMAADVAAGADDENFHALASRIFLSFYMTAGFSVS
jgi:hypothetical protein